MAKTSVQSQGTRKRQKEIEVLRHLRQNARAKLSHIADDMGMSAATAASIAKRAERYVKKYSSLVDFEKLGFFVGSFFVIKPHIDGKNNLLLMDFLSGCRNINSMSISSSGDVLVEVYFRNMADFVDFRHFVGECAEEATEHEIVCAVKREEFLV